MYSSVCIICSGSFLTLSPSHPLFLLSPNVYIRSQDHPYGMVVTDFGRGIEKANNNGEDMEEVLAETKVTLDTFSRMSQLFSFHFILFHFILLD